MSTALSLYRRILERFPKNVAFCFAYGSGVKTQLGYGDKKITDNVLDFIIAVDDRNLSQWHSENIVKNVRDYSGLSRFGGGFVSKYQKSIPANVYFNTLIPVPEENVTIKYGVVATNDLVKDCTQWTYLYLAGRLQKPVTIVSEEVPADIAGALQSNLSQALSTAILLLPEKFTDYELFYKVAQLSYRGDFRMIFGENPKKVENIVKPQVKKFLSLYDGELKKRSSMVQVVSPTGAEEIVFQSDRSPMSLETLMKDLPPKYQRTVDVDFTQELARSLSKTVFKSSAIQSIKNIPTAGLVKAIRYSYSKAKKTFS